MPPIPSNQARAAFTQALLQIYVEKPKVYSFFRSFFPSVEHMTRYVSIEVQRGTEKVAVDVLRGTDGNRNSFSRSTQKVIDPPLFDEYFDITELDLYDFLQAPTIDAAMYNQLILTAAEKVQLLVNKIERAYELMCAQVLQTGIVTLKNQDNIDFKRKSESIYALTSGNRWDDNIDPAVSLITGASFLREKGKAQGTNLNLIMGGSAFEALKNNAKFAAKYDIRNIEPGLLRTEQQMATGAVPQGTVSFGSFRGTIFTYPEVYEAANGTMTKYLDEKNVIMLPENPDFKLAFAAVPQLITGVGSTQKGAYVFKDFPDEKHATHEYHVKSAGIAVPTAVDQIYTMKVLN